MTTRIIVDGYNLMLAGQGLDPSRLRDLEGARESLLKKLEQYQRSTGNKIQVVFDGSYEGALYPRRTKIAGIEVIFSSGNQKADDVIYAMVKGSRGGPIVVTSDRALAACAEKNRCTAVSSEDFATKIEKAKHKLSKVDYKEEEPYGSAPGTKKRGNPRRPPKKERQRQSKLRKL